MTLNEAREAVFQRFIDEWGATTAYTLEGEASELDEGSASWARVSMQSIDGGLESMGAVGSRGYDREADLSVQVFTPIDAGMRQGDIYAQQARAIFEGTTFSGIHGLDGQVIEGGSDGKWQQHLAQVRLRYYETK